MADNQYLLFNPEESLFQVVRPCSIPKEHTNPNNWEWKKGLEVYGSRKDCEAYIKLESPSYLVCPLRIEPYNEADWSDTKNCVITSRDFHSHKAKEMVEYLKLPYDKRKLVLSFNK